MLWGAAGSQVAQGLCGYHAWSTSGCCACWSGCNMGSVCGLLGKMPSPQPCLGLCFSLSHWKMPHSCGLSQRLCQPGDIPVGFALVWGVPGWAGCLGSSRRPSPHRRR